MWFTTFVWKNLRQRPMRSLLTIFAIAMAIGSVVSLVGLANSFEQTFLSLYQNAKIDMMVLRSGARQRLTSALPESLGDKMKNVPGVKEVYRGLVDMVAFEDAGLYNVVVQGWEPETPVFDHFTITSGRSLRKDDTRAVLLGTILANSLGKKINDTVEVIESRPYTVVGIHESRNVLENGALVIPLKELQTIMGRKDQVTGFSLILDNPNDPAAIESVHRQVQELSTDLKAFSTADYVKSFTEIRLAKSMAWLTSSIALLIGFFGITNTMVRAVGWQVWRIIKMILLESVFLSVLGAFCGILGATVIAQILTRVPSVNGLIDPRVDPVFFVIGFAIAVALGLLGSILPAIRAVNLMPTEALRHEYGRPLAWVLRHRIKKRSPSVDTLGDQVDGCNDCRAKPLGMVPVAEG
jgi:putative ABC transport system permease protein